MARTMPKDKAEDEDHFLNLILLHNHSLEVLTYKAQVSSPRLKNSKEIVTLNAQKKKLPFTFHCVS